MSRIRGLYVAQIILAVDEERTESTPHPLLKRLRKILTDWKKQLMMD